MSKLKDIWSDWGGMIFVFALILATVSMFWGIHYTHTHQTVDLGDGLEVRVAGYCWYVSEVEKTGRTNQFFASNELGFSDMSMEPCFTIVNTSDEPREVEVHTLSAWRVPISGNVHLEPGQEFKFQIEAKYKHWYCWINPPKKSV